MAVAEKDIRRALRDVIDPEIGMSVVELGLIREIHHSDDETEVRMLLTTPFCPMAGYIVSQVRQRTEEIVNHPAKVTLLPDRWDESMMEEYEDDDE